MSAIAEPLLAWYDLNARELPWRVGPAERANGVLPDPYRVWLSEVMLQQTTVAAVRDRYARFIALWPDVFSLASANDDTVLGEWAGLGYYARARNLLKCAREVALELGGTFPDTEETLGKLPGIGPYTAAAIAAIAFDRPAAVMDGNVERVVARLAHVDEPLPAAKSAIRDLVAKATPKSRPGDFAQAMMDLGATVCTPRSPSCMRCPLRSLCLGHACGAAASLPRRPAKPAKPTRHGIAYVARDRDRAWLLERRPGRGLLGGMLGWPCSEWTEGAPLDSPPCEADWVDTGLEARHVFTHFNLVLRIKVAALSAGRDSSRYGSKSAPRVGNGAGAGGDSDSGTLVWIPEGKFREENLPTAMRKVFSLARDLVPQQSQGARRRA